MGLCVCNPGDNGTVIRNTQTGINTIVNTLKCIVNIHGVTLLDGMLSHGYKLFQKLAS